MRLAALAVGLFACGCGPYRVWFGHSADRAHALAVIEYRGKQWVAVDGAAGPRTLGVSVESLAVTRDGAHLAYAARSDAGWCVVHDGQWSEPWDAIGELSLSEDGRRVAAVVQRGSLWRVVQEGRAGPPFEVVLAGSLRQAQGHLAYAGERAGAAQVIVDGVAQARWDAVGHLALSSDGVHHAYAARRAQQAFAIFDGVAHGPFEAIAEIVFARGPAATVRTAEGWHVLAGDGRLSAPWDRLGALRVSPRDGHLAYAARRGARHMVVDGPNELGPWLAVSAISVAFDAEGALLSFSARSAQGWHAVLDGVPGPPFESVETPTVAGGVLAHLAAERGGAVAVVGAQTVRGLSWASDLVLSADGRRFALLAGRGPVALLVVDGIWRPEPEAIDGTLAFSSDGRRLGFVANNPALRTLEVRTDDGEVRRIDHEELIAAVAKSHGGSDGAPDPELLRRWVVAELERMPQRGPVAAALGER